MCVEPKVTDPPRTHRLTIASSTSTIWFPRSLPYMVNHVVFQDQPYVSRSTSWFKVNHGLKSTHSTRQLGHDLIFPVRSPILYPEFTQSFDSKCYKLFTSNAKHFDVSSHKLAIAASCCFYCYAMRDYSSPFLH
jgi:hypothetical protein